MTEYTCKNCGRNLDLGYQCIEYDMEEEACMSFEYPLEDIKYCPFCGKEINNA